MLLPKARTHQLIVRALPDETLIYDQTADKAHCLNRTAALVWEHCDGKMTAAELSRMLHGKLGIKTAEPLIHLTLEKLARRRLLESMPAELAVRQDRRKVLRRLALAALPVILTMTAPRAAQAASQAAPCVPKTCAQQGLACGPTVDGCGKPLDCGACQGATPNCCIGTCTNLQTDNNNCGSCGQKCQPGFTCANGQCTAAISDRNAKESFAEVDIHDVLSRVVALPIQAWSYKDQAPVRHIGPMAQDFAASFNVGEDDKHINLLDANGVALAAIQALHQVVQQRDEELRSLKAEIQELRGQLAVTSARVQHN
jgi:hypothetical protein